MILEVTRLDVHPGKEPEFEQVLPEAMKLIASAPGYLGHSVKRHTENRNCYVLLIRWRRQSDSDRNFRGSARHKKIKKLLHRFYELYPRTDYYETPKGFPDELPVTE